MIPKIRKVLYATDLSSNSVYAFRYAVNTALMHKARLVILHVIEQLPPHARAIVEMNLSKEQEIQTLKDAIQASIDKVQTRLKNFCTLELKDNPECENIVSSIVVIEGYPVEEILKKADEYECDIIIIGSHGKGMLSHAFLGSVAEKILKRSRKPVYVIPLPKDLVESEINEM